MQIESDGGKGRCLQYSEFQDQAHLSPLLPHHQPGYFGEGFESSDHPHLCFFCSLSIICGTLLFGLLKFSLLSTF
jgi:hypothetical protein